MVRGCEGSGFVIGQGVEGRTHAFSSVCWTSVHERFRVVCAAVHGICLLGCDLGCADAGCLVCAFDESLREIMSVYERYRVFRTTEHGICLMGRDRGLADAGCLVCAFDESLREIMSVYERFGVD